MSDAVLNPPTVWLDLPNPPRPENGLPRPENEIPRAENEIPRAENGLPTPEPMPPDTQEALERFAEKIAGVNASQVPAIARYFSDDPGRARFSNIARRLLDRSLANLLQKMTADGRAPSAAALPDPALAALARKSLLSRMFDRGRIEALQRACEAVSTPPVKQGSFRAYPVNAHTY